MPLWLVFNAVNLPESNPAYGVVFLVFTLPLAAPYAIFIYLAPH